MMAAFLKPSTHSEPVEGRVGASSSISPVIPAKAGIQHEASDGLDSHLHGNDESFNKTTHSELVANKTVRPEPVEGRAGASSSISPVIPAKAGIQHETSDGLDSHLHGNDESFNNTAHSEPVEGQSEANFFFSAVIPAKAGIQHEEGTAL